MPLSPIDPDLVRVFCRGSRVEYRGSSVEVRSRVEGRKSTVEGPGNVKKVNILSYIKSIYNANRAVRF